MLDANMILRYLLNDNIEMADEAEKIIFEGSVYVSIELFCKGLYLQIKKFLLS